MFPEPITQTSMVYGERVLLALSQTAKIYSKSLYAIKEILVGNLGLTSKITSISGGRIHFLAQTENEIIMFGSNNVGQRAQQQTIEEDSNPNIVSAFLTKRIVSSGCGAYFSYALCE
jgi:alpha-tubulin suppressor-like RCC1 family protein